MPKQSSRVLLISLFVFASFSKSRCIIILKLSSFKTYLLQYDMKKDVTRESSGHGRRQFRSRLHIGPEVSTTGPVYS